MLVILWAAPASASDPRFAVDRFEPSDRGNEWFANEGLGFTGQKVGPLLTNGGLISSFEERPFVVKDLSGNTVRSPVRANWVLHGGRDIILFDFLRVSFDLPVQLFADGKAYGPYGSPKHDQGFGDLRFGIDLRLLGKERSLFRLGIGAQVWAPTGSQAQWTSDGDWRVRPRLMAAGDYRFFTWSAQFGYDFRRGSVGDEIGGQAAAGVRIADQLVIGPEAYLNASTTHSSFPFEAMLGVHWRIAHLLQVGAAIGRGFVDATGDPEYRVIGSFEYAPDRNPPPPVRPPMAPPPPPPPVVRDDDHDNVPDDVDACKGIAGIPTTDPATTGCPPDTDGDGIDDLTDACPTQPGKRTEDAATNGCP